MDKSRPGLLAVAVAFLALPAFAADFYVTPTGTPSGDGTMASPWSLQRALSQPAPLKPGDTIWLRGGTYTGSFTSHLKGLRNKPIIVRQYPGEHVTLDAVGTGGSPGLDIRGLYTWFWGFEVTNSGTDRGSAAGDVERGSGVYLFSSGSKLINLVVHDAGQGVLTTDSASDAEINGCLFYYNGEDGPDRGHGHGIYVQNLTGSKRVVDNIMFDQFGWGIHAYTESGTLNNLHFEGNTSFNNGLLSQVSGATTNFLIGANGARADSPTSSAKVAKGTTLISNYGYFSDNRGTVVNLGYSKGIASPTILDNYLAGGGNTLALINAFRPIPMSGNTIYGSISGFQATEFPNNSYFTNRPTGVKVFVRPNQYEPGRANITIYNWDRVPSVGVSLKGILKAGTAYEIRNAQNFFGPAVLSGTYDGSSTLSLPMNGLAPAIPVGRPAPPPTGPEFQVFIVLPKATASNGKPPVASFSFGPRSPAAGQAVAFTDASAGDVTSRIWDFGDAASGAANTSALSSPAHTYAAPGTYTVQLTASAAGGDSTRSREITVGASPGTREATLPVAGHVRGATGTTFLTDVAVENPTSAPVSAQLIYTPSGGGSPLSSELTLGPGEIRVLPDVVASLFGIHDSLGSLQAATSGSPPAPLRIASRTYVDDEGATLGLGAVGLSSADRARGNGYLSNVAITDAFRSNVGALNLSDTDEVVTLQLHDYSGNILGRAFLALAAGAQGQWSLSQLFPSAAGSGMTVRLAPQAGDLAPFAYAAVTDNASSDPTYYAASEPAPVQYVPAIASVSGAGGAHFQSELSIANGEGGLTSVTVTFLEHDRNNTSAPATTLVLAPFETLHSDDALNELFGKSETYGALKIESDRSPGVTVFQRISTGAALTEGTVGQQVDAVSAEDFTPNGTILGLRQDAAFRSNLGMVNPGNGNAPVTLTLIRSPAIPLATATVVVPPRGYVQRNLASLFPSSAIPAGETLSIAIDGGGNPVFAFGSVIDNTTQDPTYYPAQY